MSDYSDLISEFGSKGATNKVVTPHADLIAEFGSGNVAVEVPKTQTEADILLGPPTPEKFEASKKIEAQQSKKPFEFYKLPVARYQKSGLEEARTMIGEGVKDFSQNKPFTAVGKVGLGTAQGLLNTLPILSLINEGTNQLTKLTGNPEFAKRADLVVTSGLPIAPLARPVTAAMPSSRSIKAIVEAVGTKNLPAFIDKLKSNPRLTAMDVDPNVQVINQGLAAKPGEPRNILDKFVEGRKNTQKDVVIDAYDDVMGAPVNVLEKINKMKQDARTTGSNLINPIVENSQPADITNIIKFIDDEISKSGPVERATLKALKEGKEPPLPLSDAQNALFNKREKLRGDWKDADEMFLDVKGEQGLHKIQTDIRREASELLNSSDGSKRLLGHRLMEVRNKIVDAIDTQTGGEYRKGLSQYADDIAVQEAFDKGQSLLKKSNATEARPEFLQDWLSTAKPPEIEALKEGARIAIDNQIRGLRFAAKKGTDIPEVEFNAEKLSMLFGKKETDALFKTLSDEKKIADTNSKLFQGSMTAMRTLGAEATKVRPDYEPTVSRMMLPIALEAGNYMSGNLLPTVGFTAGVVYPFARNKITKIGQALDRKTNVEIAKLSSATGEAKEALIQALQSHIPQGKLTTAQKLKLSLPVSKP